MVKKICEVTFFSLLRRTNFTKKPISSNDVGSPFPQESIIKSQQATLTSKNLSSGKKGTNWREVEAKGDHEKNLKIQCEKDLQNKLKPNALTCCFKSHCSFPQKNGYKIEQ